MRERLFAKAEFVKAAVESAAAHAELLRGLGAVAAAGFQRLEDRLLGKPGEIQLRLGRFGVTVNGGDRRGGLLEKLWR